MLYGSSPDALAASQRQYDEMYGNANRSNAETQNRANEQALQMALGQQSQQQAEADAATSRNFQATQNALQRNATTQDVATQYAGAQKDLTLKNTEEEYRQAVKDATNGALDPDMKQLGNQYPHFTPDKILNLYTLAASAKQQLAIQQAENIDKSGQPPDTSSADGLPTPQKNAVLAHIAALRAPYEQAYGAASNLANTGTRLQALQNDVTAEPLPTEVPVYTGMNALLHPIAAASQLATDWSGGPDQIETTSRVPTAADVGARMASFQAAMKANTMVQPNSAGPGFISTAPPNWRPASSLTATAPAAPQNAPPVAMTPPPSSIAPPMAPAPSPEDAQADALIAAAKDAIAKGAPESAVRQRLLQKYGLTF